MSDDSSMGVDTSGSMPSLRPRELLGSILAIIWWGWESGLLIVIDGVGDGVTGGLARLEAWISGSLLGELFAPTDALSSAFATNAAFIREIGIWGLPVAVIEVVAVIILLSWLARITFRGVVAIIPGGGG